MEWKSLFIAVQLKEMLCLLFPLTVKYVISVKTISQIAFESTVNCFSLLYSSSILFVRPNQRHIARKFVCVRMCINISVDLYE